MDLSEFDGLEPVSEHELKTLIQHLPDGALGLFERRLILRVLELEDADVGEYDIDAVYDEGYRLGYYDGQQTMQARAEGWN
jgi:hypothetical protein